MRETYKTKARRHIFTILGFLIGLIAICIALIVVYNNRMKKITESILSDDEIIGMIKEDKESKEKEEDFNELEQASMELGKSINEVSEELKEKVIDKEKTEEVIEVAKTEEISEEDEINKKDEKQEVKKELKFVSPVEGEILREFAKDNLVFSDTLKEWITHNGIDIKADRTTIVKAAEDGTIEEIKQDPRYGLSVIISHTDGYETIYANLLTCEFVKQGDNVVKGESIGTIGNSAAFEIADEPHLHFEIIFNGEYVDPKLYIDK